MREDDFTLLDGLVIVFPSLLFIVYHIVFYRHVYALDTRTQLSLNILSSYNWINKHASVSDPASCTLAVQTLRNAMIVGVFVGGSSLQFAYAYANSYSPDMNIKSKIRSAILSILLFFSFLCWANVIRIASHLSFLVGTLDKKFFMNTSYHELGAHPFEEELGLHATNAIKNGTDTSTKTVPTEETALIVRDRVATEGKRMIKSMLVFFR